MFTNLNGGQALCVQTENKFQVKEAIETKETFEQIEEVEEIREETIQVESMSKSSGLI